MSRSEQLYGAVASKNGGNNGQLQRIPRCPGDQTDRRQGGSTRALALCHSCGINPSSFCLICTLCFLSLSSCTMIILISCSH